jgi:hypothetical protein
VNVRGARMAVAALGALALLALAALTVSWFQTRARILPPRFSAQAFVALGPAVGSAPPAGTRRPETWLVAVNPACDHCASRCSELARTAVVRAGHARLVALLVDAPARPHVDTAGLGASAALWDSAGVWRGRWGRRAYGEALCFDEAGRCRRVVPPDAPLVPSP